MRPGSERMEKNLPNRERWGSGKSGRPEGAWVNAGHCEKAWLVGAWPRVPVCISRSGRECGGAGFRVGGRGSKALRQGFSILAATWNGVGKFKKFQCLGSPPVH